MKAFVNERPSRVWDKMRRYDMSEFGEEWENKYYYCTVRRYESGFGIGGGPWINIGISNIDETARHDWRDFQRIKNDICGDEWEAVELYPAESRLIDPSNRFYLWCAPKGVFSFGLPENGRRVWSSAISPAPQRPFPGEK